MKRQRGLVMLGSMVNWQAALIIERFHEVFDRHDANALADLLTEDTVFEDISPAPDGWRIEGKAGVAEFWRILLFVESVIFPITA